MDDNASIFSMSAEQEELVDTDNESAIDPSLSPEMSAEKEVSYRFGTFFTASISEDRICPSSLFVVRYLEAQ